jgi:homoserine kinase
MRPRGAKILTGGALGPHPDPVADRRLGRRTRPSPFTRRHGPGNVGPVQSKLQTQRPSDEPTPGAQGQREDPGNPGEGTWRVRVPGSTSNLGPGFDQLGLALGLYLRAELRVGGPARGQARSRGPLGWPPPERDLLFAALFAAAPEARERELELRVESEIPMARGLGSSGAAVAAGLLLADALSGRTLETAERLRLGIALEGHPDNVTASLLGGLTLCVPLEPSEDPGGAVWLSPPVHPSLRVACVWPERPFPTAEARAALPKSVPLADAVENARRLPILLAGLADGDGRRIRLGAVDRLHEPYRLPLLPGSSEALAAAREAGAFAANLSGSGSALVAIAEHNTVAAVAHAMATALARSHGEGVVSARILEIAGAPDPAR